MAFTTDVKAPHTCAESSINCTSQVADKPKYTHTHTHTHTHTDAGGSFVTLLLVRDMLAPFRDCHGYTNALINLSIPPPVKHLISKYKYSHTHIHTHTHAH